MRCLTALEYCIGIVGNVDNISMSIMGNNGKIIGNIGIVDNVLVL